MKTLSMKNRFYIIFAISGFSGLIYESIWSHYLKLFLGHAAYAQTLVLAIFMGGMAIGAWACAKYSGRWRNLLLYYAGVEAVIGIAAIAFHPIFDNVVQLAYSSLLPSLESSEAASIAKWLIAALLILPQSILLGATFPLMTAGLIRRFPDDSGKTIGMLYFSNSIGAFFGVLVSGFLLIAWLGLPGTIIFAGALNILLAITVWKLSANQNENQETHQVSAESPRNSIFFGLVAIAALTGAASFIYEIVWIRMLSLVLGSSTHSFELMLSAFILGLALGGLWIRHNIHRLTNLIKSLAVIQLVMGLLALATLPFYDFTFSFMQWASVNIPKTEFGYILFNLSSHVIAMAIMLPATFFAGMTLPLLTYALLQRNYGEQSIGAIYAANTLGAIIGVFFAVHIGMPLLGIKGLLTTGAFIDIALAVVLIAFLDPKRNQRQILAFGSIAMGGLLIIQVFVDLDIYKMSSGVYRKGTLFNADNTKILFHQDGKVATVDLQQQIPGGYVRIITNGKVDANLQTQQNALIGGDEPTMVLAAAIPMAMKLDSQNVAVIGMGSGLTTHTLLRNPNIKHVDTIEIEPAMVAAAKGFGRLVELTYSDPRSQIHIDDAKTYFSTHNSRYDIIISEPSNPWVSGTANLFSREFYRFLPRYLKEDGVLVQWLQLYELNIELVASVMKALSQNFKHYVIYASTDADIIIIASNAELRTPDPGIFQIENIRNDLSKVFVRNMTDIQLRFVGNKKNLDPLFFSYEIIANSDYYPVLDLGAAKARFLNQNGADFVVAGFGSVPAKRIFGNQQPITIAAPTRAAVNYYTVQNYSHVAVNLRNKFIDGSAYYANIPVRYQQSLKTVFSVFIECQSTDPDTWMNALLNFSTGIQAFLSDQDLQTIWRRITQGDCFSKLSPQQQDWISVFDALSARRFKDAAGIAEWLLKHSTVQDKNHIDFLVTAALLSNVMQNNGLKANEIWNTYHEKLSKDILTNSNFRLIAAAAGVIPRYKY